MPASTSSIMMPSPPPKQGLGRLVVTEAEKRAAELGCRKAVLDSRDVAVGFYEKLGYTADYSRIVKGWAFNCIHMEKMLDEEDR